MSWTPMVTVRYQENALPLGSKQEEQAAQRNFQGRKIDKSLQRIELQEALEESGLVQVSRAVIKIKQETFDIINYPTFPLPATAAVEVSLCLPKDVLKADREKLSPLQAMKMMTMEYRIKKEGCSEELLASIARVMERSIQLDMQKSLSGFS